MHTRSEALALNAAVLFTGGKDSVYSIHKALSEGINVRLLIGVYPLYNYSMLYHRPDFNVLSLQAYSLGIPLESVGVYSPDTELEALEKVLLRAKKRYGVDLLISGAIRSNFQKSRFANVAEKLGLETYFPLWGVNQEDYLRNLISHGIKFIIVSITTMGLPHDMLGKIITKEMVEEIVKRSRKYGFNPAFEGGEAETLVVDAPLFKYRILVDGKIRTVSEFEAYFDISKAWVVKKSLSFQIYL